MKIITCRELKHLKSRPLVKKKRESDDEWKVDILFIFSFCRKKKMINQLRDELAQLTRERDGIELEVEAASSRLRAAGVGIDKPLVDAEVRREERIARRERSINRRRAWEKNITSKTKQQKIDPTHQGFPIPNLDLAAIRGDRHLVITRMNDHKALTNRVEEVVKRLFEENKTAATTATGAPAAAPAAAAAAAPARPPPQARPAVAAPHLARLLPFARVDNVAASSPAEEAGMLRGDRVVSFGSISVSVSISASSSSSSSAAAAAAAAPGALTRLPAEVAAALASRGSIDVVVLRAGGGGGEGSEGGRSASETAAAVREISLRLVPREGWGGRGALGCHLRPL